MNKKTAYAGTWIMPVFVVLPLCATTLEFKSNSQYEFKIHTLNFNSRGFAYFFALTIEEILFPMAQK